MATAGDPGPPETWEEAQPTLRIRLYNRPFLETAGGDADQFVQFEIVRGLHATVVYDTPEAVRPITKVDSNPWGVEVDQIVDAARTNTFADPDLVAEAFELEDGTPLISLGGSFYASSFVLDLQGAIESVGGVPEAGALVIVPVGDIAIIHLIESEAARDAINVLGVIAEGWYADGPSSLSPFVYWWRADTLREVAVAVPDRGVALVEETAAEFLAVIEGITG